MTTLLPDERAHTGPVPDGAPAHDHLPIALPQDVAVIQWPEEAARRHALDVERRPRLLVLAPGAAPPLVWDVLEDWVHHDADPAEVRARATRLALVAPPVAPAGAATPAPLAPPPDPGPPALPVLDADDVLRGADDRWVALSQIEGRLLHLLLERPRQVVRREELEAAAWPRTTPGARALDVAIVRLRRRIEPFALSIHTVRGTGYLLEADRG